MRETFTDKNFIWDYMGDSSAPIYQLSNSRKSQRLTEYRAYLNNIRNACAFTWKSTFYADRVWNNTNTQ